MRSSSPSEPLRAARRAGALTVCSELLNPGVRERAAVRTRSFSLSARRTLLGHRLHEAEIDNDLGDRIAEELVRPGLLDDFEAAFAGVVTSSRDDPLRAWAGFYDRTLTGLAEPARPGAGAIATFGSIYRHALGLIVGESLLDAGSCFGFLPLLAAERGLRVTGTDLSAATVALASRIAVARGSEARFAVADVTRGLPGRADTVSALHVLEHLGPEDVPAALGVLCAAARRRVVVAVPLESVPDPTYGHRTAFADLEALRALAAPGPGWRVQGHVERGGWLVLDRVPGRVRSGEGLDSEALTLAPHAGAHRPREQHLTV